MERMGETRARENMEREGERRKCGTDTVDYLRDKREQERKIKKEEVELRKREACRKRELRIRELEMKERAKVEGERT